MHNTERSYATWTPSVGRCELNGVRYAATDIRRDEVAMLIDHADALGADMRWFVGHARHHCAHLCVAGRTARV